VRQLDPVSNLVLCALAAAGLLATLSLPWFADPAIDKVGTDGPVEKAAFQVSHFFGHGVHPVSGSDAVGSNRSILFLAVAILLGLACSVTVPSLRKQAEDLLKVAALGLPVVVIGLAFTHSGTTGQVKAHYGILVSFVVACFASSCAVHGASMRTKRKQAPKPIRISGS
jgi:hypothetical protein